MAKIRRAWVAVLSFILSLLGFAGCKGPVDMYGPETPDNTMMVMYGPPKAGYVTKSPAAATESATELPEAEGNPEEAEEPSADL